jgi:hypothetical protein
VGVDEKEGEGDWGRFGLQVDLQQKSAEAVWRLSRRCLGVDEKEGEGDWGRFGLQVDLQLKSAEARPGPWVCTESA